MVIFAGPWRAKVRGSIKEIAEWVGEDGFKRNDQKCPSVKLLLFLSSSFNLENKGHDDGTRVKTTLSYKIHGVLRSTLMQEKQVRGHTVST